MNDPAVDVIYVGTVHTQHLPHTKLALEAGKPVVCEKPLAVNAAQAQEMIDLARRFFVDPRVVFCEKKTETHRKTIKKQEKNI